MAILLPLLPVTFIFIRNHTRNTCWWWLAALCICHTFQYILLLLTGNQADHKVTVNAIGENVQIILLGCFFCCQLQQVWYGRLLQYLLVAFISCIVTVYSLTGLEKYPAIVSMVQACVTILMSLFCLWQLLQTQHSFLIYHPLFWIGSGTFCLGTMQLLAEIAGSYFNVTAIQQETEVLLAAVSSIRFIFYTIGVYITPPGARTIG